MRITRVSRMRWAEPAAASAVTYVCHTASSRSSLADRSASIARP